MKTELKFVKTQIKLALIATMIPTESFAEISYYVRGVCNWSLGCNVLASFFLASIQIMRDGMYGKSMTIKLKNSEIIKFMFLSFKL